MFLAMNLLVRADTPVLDEAFGVKKVAGDCKFTEGPALDGEGNLLFSDGSNDRIMRLAADGQVTEYRKPCGRANGLIFDHEGRLIICQSSGQGGGRRVVRIEKDGQQTVLADTYDGKPLTAPNDVAIDRRGRIYFTDPNYGMSPEAALASGVYRIDAPGKIERVIADLQRPNGIVISPDDRLLYVSDRGTQKLHRYKLFHDGSLEPDGIVYDFSPDRGIDGMCLDERGTIYGAAGQDKTTGLFVISPAGKLLLHKPMPEFSTNVEIGGVDGRDLYLTAGTSVYKLRTTVPGAKYTALAQPDAVAPANQLAAFEAQTIDDKVQIGYGVAIGDVDGDGKPDILLADKKQYVWYQNPKWEKHVLVENLTVQDNVCIAARDLDGDGRVEVAVGAEWNPGDTVNSGAVFYLVPPDDRTQRWTPVKLPHQPVVHRMRWVKTGEKQFALVVSPLHGRGNRNGEGEGVKLLAYHRPKDSKSISDPAAWTITPVEDSLHVTHNLDPAQWDPATAAEEILYVGREGAVLLDFNEAGWRKYPFPRIEGGGEIRLGRLSGTQPFVTTIEPFHGDKLVVYMAAAGKEGSTPDVKSRLVLDDNFNQGHALAAADLLGSGSQQIVAGWRNKNRDGKVGIKLYQPVTLDGSEWTSTWVDENGMATEDLQVADLDGDRRPEIIASGRDTHNLKIYWNRPPK